MLKFFSGPLRSKVLNFSRSRFGPVRLGPRLTIFWAVQVGPVLNKFGTGPSWSGFSLNFLDRDSWSKMVLDY